MDPILGTGAGTGTGAPAPTTEPLLLGILGLVSTKHVWIIHYELNIKPTFSFLLLKNGTLALDNIVEVSDMLVASLVRHDTSMFTI